MKHLIDFIAEEFAVPTNTIGEINGFAILKPGFLEHESDFIKTLSNNGWNVIEKRKKKIDLNTAKDLYSPHKDKDFYNDLCKYMSSDEALYCTCHKDCENPIKDLKSVKEKVRKAWGKNEMENAMHSSDSLENVKRESKICM